MKLKKLITLLVGVLMALVIIAPGVMAEDIPATNITLTRDHVGIRRTEENANPEFMVTVNVSPTDATTEICWESEDPDFVSITPVPGQSHEAVARVESWPKAMTVIKAYSKDNPQIHDLMTVTVVSSRNDDVREVRRLYGELNVDEQLDVTQDLSDELANENLSFETTDSSIAAVDASGLVTAKKAGVATIKTFSGDKSFYQSNVIRTIGALPTSTPTVAPETKDVKATGLRLSHERIGLCREEYDKFPSAVVEAELSPADCNSEICWESENSELAIVTPVSENPREAVIQVVGWPTSFTTITAYVKDQPEIRDTLDLTVISRRNDDVRLVHELFKQLENGSEANLTDELVDDIKDDQITWTSNNKEVANVDHSGNVTTYKPGVAKIQALGKQSNLAQQWELTVTAFEPTGIKLSKNTINLCRDEDNPNPTADITAELSPTGTKGNVVWKSDDPGLATVTPVEGDSTKAKIKVQGWPAATTTITASLESNPEVKATAKLVVASRRNDDVKLVQKESKSLLKGEEENLTSKLDNQLQGDNITWSTTNDSVATISNGLLKAVKPGVAKIRALNVDKNMAQEWELTVNAPKVDKVTLDKTSLELEVGKTAKLQAKVTPDDAVNKDVSWSSSKDSVAKVDNGTVEAIGAGTTTITATADGKSADCEVTVKEVKKEVVVEPKDEPAKQVEEKVAEPESKSDEKEVESDKKTTEPETKVEPTKESTVEPEVTQDKDKTEDTQKNTQDSKQETVESESQAKDENSEVSSKTSDDNVVQKETESQKEDTVPTEETKSEVKEEKTVEQQKDPVVEDKVSDTVTEEEQEVVTKPEVPEQPADSSWNTHSEQPSSGLGGSIVVPTIPMPSLPTNAFDNSTSTYAPYVPSSSVEQDTSSEVEEPEVVEETKAVEESKEDSKQDKSKTDKQNKEQVVSKVDNQNQLDNQTAVNSEESTEKQTEQKDSKETKETKTYRLYNSVTNEHLFTTDENEVASLKNAGWKTEGSSWESPATGESVYRLYSPITQEHHYTKDTREVEVLKNNGWSIDNNGKALFYSGGDQPIYRLYNESTQRHHLTTDQTEYNTLQTQGWNAEGVALYSLS